jgi:hypothetical protein
VGKHLCICLKAKENCVEMAHATPCILQHSKYAAAIGDLTHHTPQTTVLHDLLQTTTAHKYSSCRQRRLRNHTTKSADHIHIYIRTHRATHIHDPVRPVPISCTRYRITIRNVKASCMMTQTDDNDIAL